MYCIGSRYDIDKTRAHIKQKRGPMQYLGLVGGVPTREKGWVSEDVLEKHIFPPVEPNDEDGGTLTLVAGLPRVYETLCGPRNDKKVEGVLKKLGWSRQNVVKL